MWSRFVRWLDADPRRYALLLLVASALLMALLMLTLTISLREWC